MKKFLQRLLWSKWQPIRTIWPYQEGWGVYRYHKWNGRKQILETGLAEKQDAQVICDYENTTK